MTKHRSLRVMLAAMLALTLAAPQVAAAAPEAPASPADVQADGPSDQARADIAAQSSGHSIDRTDREAVRAAYRDRLMPAHTVPPGWTGSVNGCNVGTESAASRAATIDAVNYYRAMVDLPPVVEEPAWSGKALQAALMMKAAGELSHYPGPSWPCYTPEGAEAAAKSNISLWWPDGPAAGHIRSYMIDRGPNNAAAGHRRWILFPPLARVGTGSTDETNALWVFQDPWPGGARPQDTSWVAWPPAGHVPWETASLEDSRRQLFRWSLSSNQMPQADYTNATVTATLATEAGTEPLTVTQEPVYNGYGDNTLVWNARRAGNTPFSDFHDADVTVTVTGIRNGGQTVAPHTYTVQLFQAVVLPPDPPTNLRATGGYRSATISWNPPERDGGAPVTGYRITRQPGDVTITVGNVTSATIDGLTNGTTYTFTVAATNSAGSSPGPRQISITPWGSPPPGSGPGPTPNPPATSAPAWGQAARLAFDITSNGVRVSWPQATRATSYDVTVGGNRVATTSSRSHVITGLQPGRPQPVTVTARNTHGTSTPLTIQLSGPPTFRDVPTSGGFSTDVRWLAAGGVTLGCNPPANDQFCPRDQVTRQQMAAFISRALNLQTTSGKQFTDVGRGSTFEQDIDRLATAGITLGCNPPANDQFCPRDQVTRQQMAAFVSRALNLQTTSGKRFTDVGRGSRFEREIDRLATANITLGCNPPANDRFCPTDGVTREQMAAFLRRGLAG